MAALSLLDCGGPCSGNGSRPLTFMNPRLQFLLCGLLLAVGASYVDGRSSSAPPAALHRDEKLPFTFVVYGDTRFTNPSNTKAANPVARRTLVQAIAAAHPAFVCIDGDITFNGYDPNDWRVWDQETAVWRQEGISVFPILGNHDLHGNHKVALANYFARFPEIKESRYYSVRAANTLL